MSFQISTAMIWFLYQSLQRSNTRQVKRGTCFGYCCSKRFRVREICNQNHVGDRGAGAFEGLSLIAWCNHFVRERHGGSNQRYQAVISHHRETFQDLRSESGTRVQERHWSILVQRKCGDIRKDFWLFCSLRKDKTYEQRVHRTYRRQHPTGL